MEWAIDALCHDDTTVSAIARHLGVAWDTCWSAVKASATRRLADPARLSNIKTLGVDEHIWRPSKISTVDKAVTVMVDLTRDEHGCLRARLLDAVQGRSGRVYADWLTDQGIDGVDVRGTIEHAALDPFRGYANAIRDELPNAVAVLDAFHLVKLAGQALDEVRQRVQQATLHRRGHKDDPLYKTRRTLLTGEEHLTDRQRQRLEKYLPVGDPDAEVEVTWRVHQQVRSIYHAESPATGRAIAEKVLATLHTCPIPEVKRLGKTLRRWREEILAYFATGGVSNGGTEAINASPGMSRITLPICSNPLSSGGTHEYPNTRRSLRSSNHLSRRSRRIRPRVVRGSGMAGRAPRTPRMAHPYRARLSRRLTSTRQPQVRRLSPPNCGVELRHERRRDGRTLGARAGVPPPLQPGHSPRERRIGFSPPETNPLFRATGDLTSNKTSHPRTHARKAAASNLNGFP